MKLKYLFFIINILFTLVFCSLGFSEGKEEVFPSKPVTILCGYGAGGSTDIQIRTIVPYFQKYLGQPVIVENLPGASGILASNKAFSSKPDGYTLIVSCLQQLVLSENLYKETARYHTRDVTFLYGLVKENPILVTHPDMYDSYAEFIKAAKSKKLKVGIPGKYQFNHFTTVLIEHLAKVNFNMIPFDGGGPSIVSVLGKHIDATMTIGSAPNNMIRQGKLRPLMVVAKERTPQYPQVPIPADFGYNTTETQIILYLTGIYGPPMMPSDRAKIIEEALAKAVKDPEYIDKINKMDAEVFPLSAEKFRQTFEQEYPVMMKFMDIIKQ